MPKLTDIKKLNIEKGMYQEARLHGITLTDLIEKLDPSANYAGTGLENLDAYQRQLMAHDIRQSGNHASLVQDFFRTDDSKGLFPEFWNRNLRIGMNRGKLVATVEDIVSATNTIDADVYKGLSVDLGNTDLALKRTAEGTRFPVAKFRTKETTINLVKVGLRIEATYEAFRRTKVNVMANAIQILGQRFGSDIVSEGLDVLLNGDGNGNPAGAVTAAVPGTISWADLLDLDMAFENFESEVLIGNKNTLKKVMSIGELRDPLIAAEFYTKGVFITPFGNVLKLNKNLPDGKLIAFNRKAGVELMEERGGSMVEADKFIDQQIQNTVISKVVGFNKVFPDSAFVLNF
jgi:hypothetical protein